MNLRLTSSAIALAAMTAPAFADVTPEQVWQSWIDYYQGVGYQIKEGGREQAGDTLTLTDVVATGGTAETGSAPASTVSFAFGTVTLSDTGDGKVRTVFSDRATGNVKGTDVDGKPYEVPFTIDMPGNSTVTSGAPEDMTHTFDYPTIDVALTTMKSGDKETPLPIHFTVSGSTGTMQFVAGATAKYDYKLVAERMNLTGDVVTENDETIKFDANMAGLEMSGDMALPQGADIGADMNAAIKAGAQMNGTMKSGPLTATFDFAGTSEDGQPQTSKGNYDGKGFDLTFAMAPEGLVYQGNSDAFTSEITGGQFPFPIKYAAESASFDLQFPVLKSEAAQPFKLAYSLAGLTMGDEIWAMMDPEAKLPRDPASLELDLTGTAKVNEDLLDPTVMAAEADAATDAAPEAGADTATDATGDAAGDATGDTAGTDTADTDAATSPEDETAASAPEPFVPVELNINQFALNAMGAKITANGQLTGPEGGNLTETPVGKLHATFEGVNGLLDTLGSMGLMPEDQLMSARMMLAMFARPVAEGEDKLTTDLEFKEDGSLSANGQPLR